MSPRFRELVAVFLGGLLGTALRAGTAEFLVHDRSTWPWATFVVNLVGAAFLGHVAARAALRPLQSSERQAFLGAGLCGGLTTFSTMQLEVAWMLEDGHDLLAISYVGTSIALGMAVVVMAGRWTRRAVAPE